MLIAALELHEEEAANQAARKLVKAQQNSPPCVSIPALGEFGLVVTRDWGKRDFLDASEKLYGYIKKGRLEVFGHGGHEHSAAKTAVDIQRMDELIDNTDAIIVACMIEDGNAQTLITMDERIITSTVIGRIVGEREKTVSPLL